MPKAPDPPTPKRPHGRAAHELRPLAIRSGVLKFAEGSAQIDLGDTRVLVSATVEKRVPPFLVDQHKGWVTAEYAMLPRATHTRTVREVSRGRPAGRSSEIQRLIGRSLRASVDLNALGEHTLILDCDVLQADGGTRTAAITAAYVALVEALAGLYLAGDLSRWPMRRRLAAMSVGIVGGAPMLDLEYCEDQEAVVDLNVVGTADGELVEVQGTGEGRSFTRSELDTLLDLAFRGISQLSDAQQQVLATTLEEVRALSQGRRRKAAPKDERELWGRPESG